jgi:NAD-dependent dihydropyrimidine dehydrogenase PreA subunit
MQNRKSKIQNEFLTLSLFVLYVRANDAYNAFAANNLAVFTDAPDAGANFHIRKPFSGTWPDCRIRYLYSKPFSFSSALLNLTQKEDSSILYCPDGCLRSDSGCFQSGDNMPAVVDESKCSGCKSCVEVCPSSAISVPEKLAIVKEEDCIDCNACEDACTTHAITIK